MHQENIKYTKENKNIDKYAMAICEELYPKRNRVTIFLRNWHWLLAGLVGIIYIIIGYIIGGSEAALEITLKFLPVPLILIWFGDAIGMITGFVGLRPPITRTSPGYLVKILGWIILLLTFWLFHF